ncbi:hypothetical protein Syun_002192 [Stephania yunnanensis]|uniref:DNA-directed RNA polymerase I subunit RPA1 n=1 Tax=Stephania yunnanensis TaxID=152371 RepID=A0AAP0LEY5_9MAGN
MHGFTCGVDDLLIVKSLDKVRKKIFERRVGEQVHAEFLGYKEDLDIKTLQDEIEKVMRVNGEAATARLDKMMSSRNAKLTNEVNDKLFPSNSSPIGLLKPFPRNCFFLMTASGAKGSQVNFQQVSSLLGQQELEGKRVPRMISGKTLPCFPPWDPSSRAGGFISDRYLTGLRPQEYYFHCMAGREGLVDTAVKTSRSGYLQRCLVKSLECLKVCYDHTVRDADGSVVQFCYGEDGIDVHKTSFLSKIKTLVVNREVVQGRLSDKCETARFTNSNDYIKGLPEALKKSTNDFIMKFSKKCQMREALMNKLSKGPHPTRLLREPQVISKLMELKYLSSLAEPGEPVGVIAAQSIGEPSTQMTLNTFHHAGQGGEVNVTLGIPRLQEILMRASENIQTPVMTCPLQRGKTRDDADCLAAKFMKVSVADVVENMEVCVVPFSVYRKKACTLYKLKMKLYSPELYPRFSDISLKDCQKTLEHVFVDELERAIKTHLTMLSKISGIKNFVQKNASGDDEESDGDLDSKHEQTGQENGKGDDGDNDDDDDDDDGEAEDLGADAQKRKSQARDEMEYEDSIENEASMNESEYIDGEPSGGFESEVDQGDPEISNDVNDDAQIHDAEDESEPGAAKKNRDRTVFVEAKGLDFEVHLRFIDEPYILLSEIAQKAAKNVYIKRASNINQCSVVEKDNRYQLQTAGVNFQAFWQMQDDLDINQIFSNDIHAILRTYGVEAARATLMKQVNAVFEDHGISVNIRHLTLVADFMTHSGQYRPMSRHGMAASVSPFSKMSFETAAEFIIKAAYHGEVDYLEAPSARICLGLPVKMGTGSFDLMQKIDI